MNPALRAQYLQRLGLKVYVPRAAVHWEGPKSADLIFLFQTSDTAIDWMAPAYQFLKKIMDAASTPGISMALCFSAQTPITMPPLLQNTRLVMFGSGLTQSHFARTINTLPLAELQRNDAAKRALWQELKAMKAVYEC